MSSNISISFAQYDSSDFATIYESIDHARTNPLLINNLSDSMLFAFEGEEYIIQEPSCTFKDLISFFKNNLKSIDVLPEEYYRPQMTAKRVYNNADFWYLIMLINHIATDTQYNRKTINIIPPQDLVKISKFVDMSKNTIRAVNEQDISNYKF